MVVTFLNWSYIPITAFLLGEFVLRRLYRFFGSTRSISCMSMVVTGLVTATIYAEYFSLFTGVGTLANIVMCVACLLILLWDRREILTAVQERKSKWWYLIGIAGIAMLCAYYTAYGDFTYDTGLYHAQSIHWIESYGVVKGLGYIHQRFAYNSSFLCLSALYSMKELFHGISLHAVSGFMAMLFVSYSFTGVINRFLQKKHILCPSNFLRLGAPLYLIIILPELTSPGTDYTTVFFIMYLTFRWMELIEEQEKEITPYALLCVMAVFMMSLKLSVGAMVILVLMPAYRLIREKRWKDIVSFLLLGILAILPYFIRTVLISGWLLYPYASVDLFHFDWKLSLETIAGDAEEIKLWARLTYDGQYLNQTLAEWVPIWWERQGGLCRNYTLAAAMGIVVGFVFFTIETVRSIRKKNHEWFEYLFLNGALFVSILFWLLSAPSHRFGYSYLFMVPLCACGTMFYRKREKRWVSLLAGVPCLVIGVVFVLSTVRHIGDDISYVRQTLNREYLVMQRDYPRGDMIKTTNDGIEVYYPAEHGGQSWYYDFPASNDENNVSSWKLRTGDIRDGFCPTHEISPYRDK